MMIKEIKQKYSAINGISKILKRMLEYDENNRSDFLDLDQFISANQYLDLHHVIIVLFMNRRVWNKLYYYKKIFNRNILNSSIRT